MAKGDVVLDLAAMYGTAKFVQLPGLTLPRNDTRALELMLAQSLLRSLGAHETPEATDVRSNPNDPPDVLVSLGERSGASDR